MEVTEKELELVEIMPGSDLNDVLGCTEAELLVRNPK